MRNKCFSVIVLLYNNYEYLFDALHSIIIQNYPCIEIIVADDGSKQFNKEQIEEYIVTTSSDNIVNFTVYQNSKNMGTVKNINRALERTQGDYIKLLSADDVLYDENVLSRAQEALEKNTIITSRVVKCDSKLKEKGIFNGNFNNKINAMSNQDLYKRLCIHNDIVATGVFFTREIINKYKLFDEDYRLLEDWPTWLRLVREGERIVFEDFSSAKYRSNTGTATGVNDSYLADKEKVFEKEIYSHKSIIGKRTYLLSKLVLTLKNSKVLRKGYRLLFAD